MKVPGRWMLARIEGQRIEPIEPQYRFTEFDVAASHAKTLPSTLTDGFVYLLEIRAVCSYGEIEPAER